MLALAVTGAFSPASPGAPAPTHPTTVPSIAVGNTDLLAAGYYSFLGLFNMTGHPVWRITGAFSATHGVGAHLMTWDPCHAWGTMAVPPTNFTGSAGSDSTGATLDGVVLGGSYVFIGDNFRNVNTTVVTITSSLEATAS